MPTLAVPRVGAASTSALGYDGHGTGDLWTHESLQTSLTKAWAPGFIVCGKTVVGSKLFSFSQNSAGLTSRAIL